MNFSNNHDDSSVLSQGVNSIDPSEGETILLALLPFLGNKKEFAVMSLVNKEIHDKSSKYLYYHMVKEYPEVSLNGPLPSPSMLRMYLPPRIVIVPGFTTKMLGATNSFPMPASQQPQIYHDPRVFDAFGSMTWSEKTQAIREYAVKVEFWLSSLTLENDLWVSLADQMASFPLSSELYEKSVLLSRAVMLETSLKQYPFFHQCFNQEEGSKVQVCFRERIVKDTNFHMNRAWFDAAWDHWQLASL